MAKVGIPDDDDYLYRGNTIVIRAMHRRNGAMPAKEWLNGLEARFKARFLAAARAIETSERIGRPAGRITKLKMSKQGLSEIHITNRGSSAPHLRAFGCWEGRDRDGINTLWIASGVSKKSNKLRSRDIDNADAIADEWREAREQ
ncbi:MAG: hypothetical protein WBQ14_08265 [Gaiellaceae bacterium]